MPAYRRPAGISAPLGSARFFG